MYELSVPNTDSLHGFGTLAMFAKIKTAFEMVDCCCAEVNTEIVWLFHDCKNATLIDKSKADVATS